MLTSVTRIRCSLKAHDDLLRVQDCLQGFLLGSKMRDVAAITLSRRRWYRRMAQNARAAKPDTVIELFAQPQQTGPSNDARLPKDAI